MARQEQLKSKLDGYYITICDWEDLNPRSLKTMQWGRLDANTFDTETIEQLSNPGQKLVWFYLMTRSMTQNSATFPFIYWFFHKRTGIEFDDWEVAFEILQENGLITVTEEKPSGVGKATVGTDLASSKPDVAAAKPRRGQKWRDRQTNTQTEQNNTNKTDTTRQTKQDKTEQDKTEQDSTKQDKTLQNKTRQNKAASAKANGLDLDFEALYQIFPKRRGSDNGKKVGLTYCKKHFKTQEAYDQLKKAIENYVRFVEDARKKESDWSFNKKFSNFLKESTWEEFVDWTPEPRPEDQGITIGRSDSCAKRSDDCLL